MDAEVTYADVAKWGNRAHQIIGAAVVGPLMWGLNSLWDGYQERGAQLDATAQNDGRLDVLVDQLDRRIENLERE